MDLSGAPKDIQKAMAGFAAAEWLGGMFRMLLSETSPSLPLAFSQPRYHLRRDSVILKERL